MIGCAAGALLQKMKRAQKICIGTLLVAAVVAIAWPLAVTGQSATPGDRNFWIERFLLPFALAILIALSTTFISSVVAVVLARAHWRNRGWTGAIVWSVILSVGQISAIPAFFLIYWLRVPLSYSAFWCTGFLLSAAGTWLAFQRLENLTRDFNDAAELDGCGFWGVYRHMMLPQMRAVLFLLALIAFVATWNVALNV